MIGPRSTLDDVLEFEARMRNPMDAATYGIDVARRALRQHQDDVRSTFVPIPDDIIRQLREAWGVGDPDTTIVRIVGQMFGATDGELLHLPTPPVHDFPHPESHDD